MWLEDDYDPLNDSDENFVEIILKEDTMEGITEGTVLNLTPDPTVPMFLISDWGTTWTAVPVDLEIADRCSFCGRQLSEAMEVVTNKEATLYLCPLCVTIEDYTTWTAVPVDLEITDRCSFCGRQLSEAMEVVTNKTATLYMCPLCVTINS